LAALPTRATNVLLGFSGVTFKSLAELGTRARSDVIQVTAVGGGFLGQGLDQAGLQGQQFLRIPSTRVVRQPPGRLPSSSWHALCARKTPALPCKRGSVKYAG